MYQKKGSQAYRPDLSRMRDFCSYLNHPQNQIKTIHVAGTNGKGSTAHLMASVMQQKKQVDHQETDVIVLEEDLVLKSMEGKL